MLSAFLLVCWLDLHYFDLCALMPRSCETGRRHCQSYQSRHQLVHADLDEHAKAEKRVAEDTAAFPAGLLCYLSIGTSQVSL